MAILYRTLNTKASPLDFTQPTFREPFKVLEQSFQKINCGLEVRDQLGGNYNNSAMRGIKDLNYIVKSMMRKMKLLKVY